MTASTPLRPLLLVLAAGLLAACSTPQGPSAPRGGASPQQPASAFIRPAGGPTLSRYNGASNKGIDIGGQVGDPVLATADGRVVYVGSELRGYGNMIIVKHNDTFISAYAHAQTLLVKEKDVVRQGQQIATMGSSGTDRVKLHFEIRKLGTAVDPEPYLSGRLR